MREYLRITDDGKLIAEEGFKLPSSCFAFGYYEYMVADTSRRVSNYSLCEPVPVDRNTFGPFENNSETVLRHLDSSFGSLVSFRLELATEKDRDYVVVIDGDGNELRRSGKGEFELYNVSTPATIKIKTDSSVLSERVRCLAQTSTENGI